MNANGYPFLSRAQILARVAADPAFALECFRALNDYRGWMASHQTAATALTVKVSNGTPEERDYAEAARLAARYGKTLARLFRERALAERPELAVVGAVFGVLPRIAESTTTTRPAVPSPVATETAPTPTPKRRGRPPGSKNRPREAAATKPESRRR